MNQMRLMMGMPIQITIKDPSVDESSFDVVFNYFSQIDEMFSPYKETSEVTRINRGLPENKWSTSMRVVMRLSEQTKRETQGYFDVWHTGVFDPSGLVKGWAINNASILLRHLGYTHFFIDAGGDIQTQTPSSKETWELGIRHPFRLDKIIKRIRISNEGVATSGTYLRGDHIYSPKNNYSKSSDIVSLTVIGPTIYEADRFATAGFAMGKEGIHFIENLRGYEGYMVDQEGIATMTTHFEEFAI